MTMFGYNNTYEKTAEERGYVPISCYDTKEEIDHVISKIHGCGAHAFKSHKTLKTCGFNIDEWVLFVKKDDLYKLRPDYKPPEKPPKPAPTRGGRRKDMAMEIIRMKDEEGMSWEEISEKMNRSFWTVQKYYYLCKRGELTEWKHP